MIAPGALAQVTTTEMANDVSIARLNSYHFKDDYRNLSLDASLEQGLRSNYSQIMRKYQKNEVELKFKNDFAQFWYPNLNLNFTTTTHKVARITNLEEASATNFLPSGKVAFEFDEYTVFNWGKDYMQFLNAKSSYHRNIEILAEKKRELKHDIIIAYFRLNAAKKISKINKNFLRQASFIYRLSKEKVAIKKISKQEYYQARTFYLKAQTLYHDSKLKVEEEDQSMAEIISDPAGTRYLLQDDLKYIHIKISYDESLRIAPKRNPKVLDADTKIEQSKRDYMITLKDNLPLPKFTMKFGAYAHTFGPNQNANYDMEKSNFEVLATINATWSIAGSGGLFNRRTTKLSLVNRHLAHLEKDRAIHYAKSTIRKHFKRAIGLQDQIVILESRIPALEKEYDTILANFLDRKTAFINFEHSLEELINAQVLDENYKYQHVYHKVNVARNMGVEDFPGENFEHMALRKEGL